MTFAADENYDDNTGTDTAPSGPTSVNGVKAEDLKKIIDRIELKEQDRVAVNEDIKIIKSEAKAMGFDVKTINQIIKLRKMDSSKIEAEELLLEVYKRALGMTE